MRTNYRFRIRSLGDKEGHVELTVGMVGEGDNELIPAHQTAFGSRLHLRASHENSEGAEIELKRVMEWLEQRW